MLLPDNVKTPVLDLVNPPVPDITLVYDNARALLKITGIFVLFIILDAYVLLVALAICNVPPIIVVSPVNAFVPPNIKVFAPYFIKVPLPVIGALYVKDEATLLNSIVPLFIIVACVGEITVFIDCNAKINLAVEAIVKFTPVTTEYDEPANVTVDPLVIFIVLPLAAVSDPEYIKVPVKFNISPEAKL